MSLAAYLRVVLVFPQVLRTLQRDRGTDGVGRESPGDTEGSLERAPRKQSRGRPGIGLLRAGAVWAT